MYIPPSFIVNNRDTLHAFIKRYSFATLVTSGDDLFVTHLPLLLDAERGEHGTLVGHFARPNPHWQVDHHRHRTCAIFHGPHAYISPSWYRSDSPAVPTWNYATVHAHGRLTIVEDSARIEALLARTVDVYEAGLPQPWVNPLPREMKDKLIAAVVAFEMPIERMEGKFKLGQNRRREDQIGAIEGLEATGDAESAALADFARDHLKLNARG